MTDTKPKKIPPVDLKILEFGYTLVPAFWMKLIADGLDKGVPASFWKYSLVLWREIVGFNCAEKGFTAKMTMDHFGIRRQTAMKWTAAYAASGLFKIDYGYRSVLNKPGIPTRLQYLDGTKEEWEMFIGCLADAIKGDHAEHNDGERDILGFRTLLTVKMFEARRAAGLSPAISEDNRAFIMYAEKRGVIRLISKEPFKVEFLRIPRETRLVALKPGEYVE